MSQRSWAPAGVSGGTAERAGCGDLAAVGSAPDGCCCCGGCGFGEVHAAARSATAIVSAASNDHARRPRLILLRARSSDILSSSISASIHFGRRHARAGAK
jgi:hypothetical protein